MTFVRCGGCSSGSGRSVIEGHRGQIIAYVPEQLQTLRLAHDVREKDGPRTRRVIRVPVERARSESGWKQNGPNGARTAVTVSPDALKLPSSRGPVALRAIRR
jgi:hypothetical protein